MLFHPSIIFTLFLCSFNGHGDSRAADLPEGDSQNRPQPKGTPISLNPNADSFHLVPQQDHAPIIRYLSSYDSDQDNLLYPYELARGGNNIRLGREMDRFCAHFEDYDLDFKRGAIRLNLWNEKTDALAARATLREHADADLALSQDISDIQAGAERLLEVLSGDSEYADLAADLRGKPLKSLGTALQIYQESGGLYDSSVPLDELEQLLSEQPDKEQEIISALFATDYTSYIGSDIPEGDEDAFAAFDDAMEDQRIESPLAFAGLYMLAAAWDNGLGDELAYRFPPS